MAREHKVVLLDLLYDVVLPLPRGGSNGVGKSYKYKWIEAYNICLEEVKEFDGAYVHSIVPKLGTILNKRLEYIVDGNLVANRFIGEMCDHSYLRVHLEHKFKSKEQQRIITLTAKLRKLAVGIPSSIMQPKGSDRKVGQAEIRRGVNNKENKTVVQDVSNHTASLKMQINQFVHSLVHKDGGNILPKLIIKEDDKPKESQEKAQMLRIRNRALDSCEYWGKKSFWFPQFFDSRGRLYPATTAGISVQGEDFEKSLIEPTYKEKLTQKGYEALLETLEGYSEQGWSVQKMERHGNNPEATKDGWMEADKPYNYIANAKYLARYLEDNDVEIPVFIPLDGRASALQHWSALLRTNTVTKYIGMEEEEPENDMYEMYRDLVHPNVVPEQKWLMEGSVGRKAAKKPVMTFAYGGKLSSTEEYIQKEFRGKATEKGLTEVSKHLYDGLNELLPDIVVGFKWVTKVARILAKAGNGSERIHWQTPDGFIASQRKITPAEGRAQVVLQNGNTFETTYKDFSITTANPNGHSTALSPNLIHSLDACHLRMVCREMKDRGLPMIFIHDSFATHANYRDELYQVIKETFVEMYSVNILQNLKDYWEYNYQVELPELPKLGNYDVRKVLTLPLFFT